MQRTTGELVAVSRSGEIAVADEQGRERERYKLPYGAVILVSQEARVDAGRMIAQWDPHTHPIITEVAGKVVFEQMEEGVSIDRQTDELTGLTSISVLDVNDRPPAGKDLRAEPSSWWTRKATTCTWPGRRCRPGIRSRAASVLNLDGDNVEIGVGDVIARIPQEGSKTRDITGGMPRVADLFEAQQAQGAGGPCRGDRHRQLRQGNQGETAIW